MEKELRLVVASVYNKDLSRRKFIVSIGPKEISTTAEFNVNVNPFCRCTATTRSIFFYLNQR